MLNPSINFSLYCFMLFSWSLCALATQYLNVTKNKYAFRTEISADDGFKVHEIKKKDGVLQEKEESKDLQNLEQLIAALLLQSSEEAAASFTHHELQTALSSISHLLDNETGVAIKEPSHHHQDHHSTHDHESHHKNGEATYKSPELQFLETELGPSILPLEVPKGYFVPFIPRKAFGVTNGVARPAHGHASFYGHRPRGLVDVRNTPAYGFLFAGRR